MEGDKIPEEPTNGQVDRKPVDVEEAERIPAAPAASVMSTPLLSSNTPTTAHAVSSSMRVREDYVEKSLNGTYVKYPELVGKGSFKIVFKAQDTEHGKLVAWNEISLKGLGEKERKRILNEMTLLKTMQHPCLIQFYYAWVNKAEQKVVFITELMTSGTLREWCAKYPVSLRQIKRYCLDILRCVHYLHTPITDNTANNNANGSGTTTPAATTAPPSTNDPTKAPLSGTPASSGSVGGGSAPKPCVIHRDLKCDNIFIQEKTIKIGDLGLAATAGRTVLGTPEFMAPEMYEPGYGAGVDIYAFGMCVLEMVTGKSPFAEFKGIMEIYRRVEANGLPENIRVLEAGWPEAYAFVMRCLTPKAVITPSDTATVPAGAVPPTAPCIAVTDVHETDVVIDSFPAEAADHSRQSTITDPVVDTPLPGASRSHISGASSALVSSSVHTASASKSTISQVPRTASQVTASQLPSRIYVRPTAAELMTDPFLTISDDDAHRTTDDVKVSASSKGFFVINGPDDEHRRKDLPPPSVPDIPKYELPPWVCLEVMSTGVLPAGLSHQAAGVDGPKANDATPPPSETVPAPVPPTLPGLIAAALPTGAAASATTAAAIVAQAAAITTSAVVSHDVTSGMQSMSDVPSSARTTDAPPPVAKKIQRSVTMVEPLKHPSPKTPTANATASGIPTAKSLQSPGQRRGTAGGHHNSTVSLEHLSQEVRVLKDQMHHALGLLEFLVSTVPGGRDFLAAHSKRRASVQLSRSSGIAPRHHGAKSGDIPASEASRPPSGAPATAPRKSGYDSESEEDNGPAGKKPEELVASRLEQARPPALQLADGDEGKKPKGRVQFGVEEHDHKPVESLASATSTGTTVIHSVTSVTEGTGLWADQGSK